MTCHKFSKKFISKFVDNELNAEDHNAFIRHKVQCPDCCAAETRFRQAGMIFERQADAIAGQLLKNTPKIFIKTGERNHESHIYRIIKRNFRRTPMSYRTQPSMKHLQNLKNGHNYPNF